MHKTFLLQSSNEGDEKSLLPQNVQILLISSQEKLLSAEYHLAINGSTDTYDIQISYIKNHFV